MNIANKILFVFNEFLLRIKRRRKFRIPKKNLKINLGCGLSVENGWINIDGSLSSIVSVMPNFVKKLAYHLTGAKNNFSISEYVGILNKNRFIHHDLRYGIPVYDGVAEYVYSSHFLEHLYPDAATRLINDIYRVLKEKGRLRLSVPDLEYAVGLYTKDKKRMLENYFFINNLTNNFSNHKYMYDFKMIETLLLQIGFKKVTRSSYKASDFPGADRLDNRSEDSLFIEAVK